jgi:hypothetical protein
MSSNGKIFSDTCPAFLSDSIVNHKNIEILSEQIHAKSLTHAYLFYGNSIERLTDIAMLFFASASCEKGGCGQCQTCKSILSKKNPSLYMLEAAGPVITNEEISSLLYFLNLSTQGEKKAAVIVEADLLNESASNKLLKTLEEPPNPDSIILLLTEKVDAILGTILSRCQTYQWECKQDGDQKNKVFFEEIAGMAHTMLADLVSAGNKQVNALDYSRKIVEALDTKSKVFSAAYEKEIETVKDSGIDPQYAKRLEAVIAARKKRNLNKFINFGINYVFDIITDWLDDIMAINAGADREDINCPSYYGIMKTKEADPDRIMELIKYIDKTRLYLNYAINRELALDCIFIRFLHI